VDSDSLFQQVEAELASDAHQFNNRARTIDAVGTVATVGVSLGSLVHKSFGAMRLTGAGLEAANREMAKDALHVAYDPARDVLTDIAAEKLGVHKGVRHFFGSALHVLANLTTPSYWAAAYTNTREHKSFDEIVNSRAETLLNEPLNHIRTQHKQTIARIDVEIRKTEAQLSAR
jgi:hypothetical protein